MANQSRSPLESRISRFVEVLKRQDPGLVTKTWRKITSMVRSSQIGAERCFRVPGSSKASSRSRLTGQTLYTLCCRLLYRTHLFAVQRVRGPSVFPNRPRFHRRNRAPGLRQLTCLCLRRRHRPRRLGWTAAGLRSLHISALHLRAVWPLTWV